MAEIDFKKFVEQVRGRNNIVDVISQYVRLDRRGMNYWGSCPFHTEGKPSFTVNEDKNMYHCFSCGRSGDIFKFIMERDNLTFMEALERLAGRAGMQMPEFSPNKTIDNRKAKYDTYSSILTETAKFYHANLMSDSADFCWEYINRRGLTRRIIITFGMGYSPSYDALPKFLLSKGYTADDIIESGVCQKNQRGDLFDFEGERLVIPIIGKSGKVIGFGGRLITDKPNAGKYLNTKETVMFRKRLEIFNHSNLKRIKQENKLKSIIVVEGYMDVISLTQAGFSNTCASMGTAFSIEQCKLLEFFSKNIYLCYDGDNAGQEAIEKAIDVFKDFNINLRIIMLPDGLDPDDVIKKHGNDYFQELVDRAVTPIEFLLRRILKKHNAKDPQDKAKAVAAAIELFRSIPTMSEREVYLPIMANLYGINMDNIRKDIDNMSVVSSSSIAQSNAVEDDVDNRKLRNPKNEKYLISARYVLFALYKGYLKLLDVNDDLQVFFVFDEHKELFDLYRINQANISMELLMEEENREAKAILELIEYKPGRGESPTKFYEDCLVNLKEQYYDMLYSDVTDDYRQETDPLRKQELLSLLNQVVKAKRELKSH